MNLILPSFSSAIPAPTQICNPRILLFSAESDTPYRSSLSNFAIYSQFALLGSSFLNFMLLRIFIHIRCVRVFVIVLAEVVSSLVNVSLGNFFFSLINFWCFLLLLFFLWNLFVWQQNEWLSVL